MKIIVTGGAGFIGSNLVDRLIEENHKVIVIDDLSFGKEENINLRAKFYKLKIQDSKISRIFEKEKPDIVFHLASWVDVRRSIEKPVEYENNNVLGSLNVFESCKKFKIKNLKMPT